MRLRPFSDTIQASRDQLSQNGVRSPLGSTMGSSSKSGIPTAVQLRFVRLTWVREKARGMNASFSGSNWRSTQKGQIQSLLCWIAPVFSNPRA